MKIAFFSILCLFVSACSQGDTPAETKYNYKTVTVDSIYTNWKKDKKTAMEKAESELARFAKSSCRRQISAGWSIVQIKNKGVMECSESAEGHHCRKKDVELECREVIEGLPF